MTDGRTHCQVCYGFGPKHYDCAIAKIEELRSVVIRYMGAHPAFRIKPVGAPGSEMRIEQERLMGLEDAAKLAIGYGFNGSK